MASPHPSPDLPPGAAHSRRAALLMLAGLVIAGSPLPYTAVAVVPLVWAGVECGLSIQSRSAANAPTRGIVSSVVGLVLVCLLTVLVLLPYAIYDTAKGLQDCALGANTAIAAADCKSRFYGGSDALFGGFLSSG